MTPEDNELLTRVGPGTLMGSLLRRYWLPLLPSDELGPPDGAPRRMRLLGEDLVAFRDSGGRVGLLAEACPHRRASLFFGRNEEGGLRCVYDGWKFDVAGRCLELPSEPPDSRLREGVRARAYPCRELNGVVWAYLGPAEEAPPLPELGWAVAPPSRRSVWTYARTCNWLQALEGDVDTVHLGWLHARVGSGGVREVAFHAEDRLRDIAVRDRLPDLHVVETPAGLSIGARRDDGAGGHYWRVSQFLMPVFTSVPAIGQQHRAKAWVPLDDEHTLVWEADWYPTEELAAGKDAASGRRTPDSGMLPDTEDPLERGRFAANRENDYGIDRERQRTSNFSGIEDSPPPPGRGRAGEHGSDRGPLRRAPGRLWRRCHPRPPAPARRGPPSP